MKTILSDIFFGVGLYAVASFHGYRHDQKRISLVASSRKNAAFASLPSPRASYMRASPAAARRTSSPRSPSSSSSAAASPFFPAPPPPGAQRLREFRHVHRGRRFDRSRLGARDRIGRERARRRDDRVVHGASVGGGRALPPRPRPERVLGEGVVIFVARSVRAPPRLLERRDGRLERSAEHRGFARERVAERLGVPRAAESDDAEERRRQPRRQLRRVLDEVRIRRGRGRRRRGEGPASRRFVFGTRRRTGVGTAYHSAHSVPSRASALRV